MKTLTIILCLILLGFGVSACNTTRGFGQDLKAVGNSIEEAAEKEKDDDN